jgi:predicted DNA-binding protein
MLVCIHTYLLDTLGVYVYDLAVKRYQIHIEEQMLTRLQALSAETGYSVSDIIRGCIRGSIDLAEQRYRRAAQEAERDTKEGQ